MIRRIVIAGAAVALLGVGMYVVGHKNAPAMRQVAIVGSVIAHQPVSATEAQAAATPASGSDPTSAPGYVGSGKQQLDCMYNASTEAAYKHFGCAKIDGPWHGTVKDPLGNLTGSKVAPATP